MGLFSYFKRKKQLPPARENQPDEADFSRVHGYTAEENKVTMLIRLWEVRERLHKRPLKAHNSAEYYGLAADGTVFKKEPEGLYRLDLRKMLWRKDDCLQSVWRGEGPQFREYPGFQDYFETEE